ncbi:DUF317 domain-containing protein [Streptomyces luteolus]|uniref:DUF317 domain-containing protein n=1 Tax=Streptomyces luteolus TaxID=3043615 RepID=A0ABT6SNV5_9ACTN|nr:DUF317 domain-containing protein [Streptomyces sp. B-S-A12]MDI3417288.1 DUF317 domain-containing protein [Streptomyces sp. B-S-A12]
MEAPLSSHRPSEPVRPLPKDPVYRVSPRHLAGDDGALAERVGETLAGLGWWVWPTARDSLLYVSPDGQCGAEWLLASYPFELGGLPVAWQVSARSETGSVMVEWNAYFTVGVPPEPLTDFLLALDARTAPSVGFDGPEVVLDELGTRGWFRDADRLHTTAFDPGFSASVSLEPLPPLVQDGDPRPDQVGWQAWADLGFGDPYLWCASFSSSVPHDLAAVFASSAASPAPVMRRTLPARTADRLSIVRCD